MGRWVERKREIKGEVREREEVGAVRGKKGVNKRMVNDRKG